MPRTGHERQPLLRPVSREPTHHLQDPDHSEQHQQHQGRTNVKAALFLVGIIVPYFICYIICHAEIGPFIYDKISREYNGSHMSSEKPCSPNMSAHGDHSNASKIQKEIQQRVATLEMYLGFTTFLTAAVPVVFLGPITDRFGRKIGFLFPVVGTLLKVITYVCIVNLDLNLDLLFLAHVFEALGGAFAAMLGTAFSVISDITLPGKRRSLHITILEALQTIVASFTQIFLSTWISSSFTQPLYLALGTGVLALLAAIFFPETYIAPTDQYEVGAGVRQRCRDCGRFFLTCLQMPQKSVMLYLRDPRGRLTKRRLCLAIFILTVAVNFTKMGPWNLYRMKYPLCWRASFVVLFNGIQMLVSWVAILLFLALFRKLFNMADRHLVLIGCFSSMTSLIFESVASNNVMVYEAVVLGIFVRLIIPMLRSMMSAEVGPHQQGTLYAGIGVIETVGAAVFGLVSMKIYSATLDTFPGAVFIMLAGIVAVTIALLAILSVIYKRDATQRYVTTLRSDDSSVVGNNDIY